MHGRFFFELGVTDMSESNVELARRGYAAVMRGDFEVIAELLHPEVKWHAGDPDAEYACRNREQALAFMRRSVRREPGELVDVIDAGGGKVVVIMQRAPEGSEPAARVANVTTFRNGRVVEMVHFPDPDDALAAAGVTPR
jgi:ketosteroid isomerase-like protein